MPPLTLHYQIAGMCTCTRACGLSAAAEHTTADEPEQHDTIYSTAQRMCLPSGSFPPYWKTIHQTVNHTNWIVIIRNQTPQTFWAPLLRQYRERQRSWVEQLFFLTSSANLQTLSNHPKISATISTSLQSLNHKEEQLQNGPGVCSTRCSSQLVSAASKN